MIDELKKDFPSLQLAYEHVKDVLHEQKETVRDYANRAITLFSVATAIIGIALPLFISRNPEYSAARNNNQHGNRKEL